MPLDAICLDAVLSELREILTGGRIDKVFQPERDELGLAVRTPGHGNVRLLISVNPSNCRIHITRFARENPSAPPMFCMLMRKHLTGARITEIIQPPSERVAMLVLDAVNEMGERVRRTLTAELMGRNSNLILVDEQDRIVDCLRRVDSGMSELRPVLPGLFYQLPPVQDKALPYDLNALRERFAQIDNDLRLDKWMCDNFSGISPLVARELCYAAVKQATPRKGELERGNLDALWSEIERFNSFICKKQYTPCLLREGAQPKEFSYLQIRQYGELYDSTNTSGFSELLDVFFTERDALEHCQKRASGLRKTVQNALERARRKLLLQTEEYAATQNRERLRECGDLLMANLGSIKRGDEIAVVEDFYHSEAPVARIPLNVALSPHQNADKYYKQYKKAKTAQEMLQKQMKQCRIDIQYLESVMDAVDRVTGGADITELREELTLSGFLKPVKGAKKVVSKPSKPMVFKSTTGMSIYVGRNNRQNDTLTLKTADKTDMWLHVQKIAGSHVIIDCAGEAPDNTTLEQAAILAATYSQARNGQKVPVDYTQVKYVKKMAGGKPGMVIYDRFKTVFVDPDTKLAESLKI